MLMSNYLLAEFNLGIAVLTVQFIIEIYWMNLSDVAMRTLQSISFLPEMSFFARAVPC